MLQKIMARGYRNVSVQHRVGRYRIDIVVEGTHARLAVECDGDRWHGPDVWHKDRARQQVLERASWTFERIRGSAFYRDPDTALVPLWQRLADLGIPAGDWSPAQTPQPVTREVTGQGRPPDPVQAPDDTAADGGSHPATAPRTWPPAPVIVDATPAGPEPGTILPSAASSAPLAEPAAALNAVDAEETCGGNRDPNGAGRPEPAVQAASIPSGNRTTSSLPRYQEWNPRVLSHPDTTPLPEVITGILEIVAVEGPIHAQRAYRSYTLAAGGLRVGTEMRRAFHAATRQALRTGALHQLEDKLVSQDEKTLYIPGKPSVLVRELGPRQLSDVPRSEVAKLIKYLCPEGAADDVVKRAVLHAYGLIRLTARTSQYLDECLSYRWHRHATV